MAFDATEDAKILRSAMKGIGTDEATIINVLTNRTGEQRQSIVLKFKTLYGKDLIEELKSELSGRVLQIVLALVTPLVTYKAQEIYEAIHGAGTDEKVLIDLVLTADNSEIRELNKVFQELYKKTLEECLTHDTSGHFRRLLISASTGNRSESEEVDKTKAVTDAQLLYEAGVQQWGTDESKFNEIVAAQSASQLRATFEEYLNITGVSVEEAIRSEMSGDLQDGFLAVVKCIQNKQQYFAERLHWCVSGPGTRDNHLIRLIVLRSEVDLPQIKEVYHTLYGTTLSEDVSDDISGDYRVAVLAIIK